MSIKTILCALLTALALGGCSSTPVGSPVSADTPRAPRFAAELDAPVSREVRFEIALPEKYEKQPQRTKPLNVVYPFAMKRQGIQGKAVVHFLVSPSGLPEQIQVSTATNGHFAQAAIEAVQRLTFRPAISGGQPAYARMELPVQFAIRSY